MSDDDEANYLAFQQFSQAQDALDLAKNEYFMAKFVCTEAIVAYTADIAHAHKINAQVFSASVTYRASNIDLLQALALNHLAQAQIRYMYRTSTKCAADDDTAAAEATQTLIAASNHVKAAKKKVERISKLNTKSLENQVLRSRQLAAETEATAAEAKAGGGLVENVQRTLCSFDDIIELKADTAAIMAVAKTCTDGSALLERCVQEWRDEYARIQSPEVLEGIRKEKFNAMQQSQSYDREMQEALSEIMYRRLTVKNQFHVYLRYCQTNLLHTIHPPCYYAPHCYISGCNARLTPTPTIYCPSQIAAWTDFCEKPSDAFFTLWNSVPDDKRLFPSQEQLNYILYNASHCASSDPALRAANRAIASSTVKSVIRFFRSALGCQNIFYVPDINNTHSHASNKVTSDKHLIYHDQTAVLLSVTGSTAKKPLHYVKYKIPTKLTVDHLRAGLRDVNDIDRFITNFPTPDDASERFIHQSEKLCFTILAEVYDQMLRAGLEYSYVTTHLACIFLRIDWEHPSTLYYHFVDSDGLCSPELEPDVTRFAIIHILAITLLSMKSEPKSVEARHAATQNCKVATTSFESVLDTMATMNRPRNKHGYALKVPPQAPESLKPVLRYNKHVCRFPDKWAPQRERLKVWHDDQARDAAFLAEITGKNLFARWELRNTGGR